MVNSQSERKDRLRTAVQTVIDDNRIAITLRRDVLEIADILKSAGNFSSNPSEDIGTGETWTAHGLALSPTMAAMCADEYLRTVIFIRGLHAAIKEVRARVPDRAARILYVGCGPLATLAVPLMSVFLPREVNFEMLDVHHDSIDSARSVVTTLGFGGYVSNYHVTEASSFQIQPDAKPDVIVAEIMNACLEKEPQVSVTRHLLAQAPSAILVPESVTIDARLVDLSKEFDFGPIDPDWKTKQRDRVCLGEVFELSKKGLCAWQSGTDRELPASAIEIPEPLEARYRPMLFTHVRVFGDYVLEDYDCSLTVPRPFPVDGPVSGGDKLEFQYRLGTHPGLRCVVQ